MDWKPTDGQKRQKKVKDSSRAGVKVIGLVNIQQIYFEAYIFFNTIDNKQWSNFND